MRKLIKEFGDFINKGNVMDLAVGVIIGGAFTAIVNALIENIINPLIASVGGGTGEISGMEFLIPGTSQVINFGAFLGAVINFLITAGVVFLLVRGVTAAREAAAAAAAKAAAVAGVASEDEEEAPAPRTCPYCHQEIADDAVRCPHCTSILPNATAEQVAGMAGAAK